MINFPLLALALCSLGAVIAAVVSAPEGHENATGFHRGKPSDQPALETTSTDQRRVA